MATFEQDREDILREATALVERFELIVPDRQEPVIVGFRRDGSASFFFGSEFVLQFNTSDELRRGYDHGQLIKAEGGQLLIMQRHRHEHEVTLLTRNLSASESNDFCQRVIQHLHDLRESLTTGCCRIGRQIPEGTDVAGRVRQWLERFTDPVRIANRPNVKGLKSKDR